MGSVPLLSRTIKGEELYLYLAVSPIAVSSALVRQEDGVQKPVYYTSRALRGGRRTIPQDGVTSPCPSNIRAKAAAVFLGPHRSSLDRSATQEDPPQARDLRSSGQTVSKA